MSHWLWIGIMVGVLVGTFLPELVRIVLFFIALLLSDLVHGVSHDVSHIHAVLPLWLLGIGGVAFGFWAWHYARKRGLGHLGQAELSARWGNARKISKWGW